MNPMYITFHSVSEALLLEELLQLQGRESRVVPVPRALSSSCGYAVETGGQPEALAALMDEKGVEWEGIYAGEKDGYTPLLRSDASN